MSFLEKIKLKKGLLKPTETVVTYVDGRRFIESNSENVQLRETTKYGFVIDDRPDNVPASVTKNIYLGSQDCCEQEILFKFNIRFVLSVGVEPLFKFPDVSYKFIECLDLQETDIRIVLLDAVPFVKKAIRENAKILIHCNAGVSRSSAVVIGFLMFENNITYLDAYDIVKRARNCIRPNAGFEKQLKTIRK